MPSYMSKFPLGTAGSMSNLQLDIDGSMSILLWTWWIPTTTINLLG